MMLATAIDVSNSDRQSKTRPCCICDKSAIQSSYINCSHRNSSHSYVHKKIHILQVAECYAAHSMHMVRGDKLLDSDVRSKTLSLGVEQGLGTRD